MKTEMLKRLRIEYWTNISRWAVAVVGAGLLFVSTPITPMWLTLGARTASAVSTAEEDLPTAVPEEVGMSTERLSRIADVVDRAIEAEAITGAVTLVARRGKVAHFEAHGLMNLESMREMETDTIFQIASMTKPVAGVAFLLLLDNSSSVC